MLIGGYHLFQLSVNGHEKTEGNAKWQCLQFLSCNILA